MTGSRCRRGVTRRGVALILCLLATPDVRAIDRDAFKEIRGRFEGLTFRLRVDLKSAVRAIEPNVVSLDGVGYPSERATTLFYGLETVYLERITNEGGARLVLTVYRSAEEARRLRASAVPPPTMANPNFGGTIAAYAQQGSTSVVFEVKAAKKDRQGQLREIETLLDRVFYVSSEPTRQDLEDFVRRHRGMPVTQLRALTGLPEVEIRTIQENAAAP
jgi:hypothetical protein